MANRYDGHVDWELRVMLRAADAEGIMDVAATWNKVSNSLNSYADSIDSGLLTLREFWGGHAAERHEAAMAQIAAWLRGMANEAFAMQNGLTQMTTDAVEARRRGDAVPVPPPKETGSFWGVVGGVATLGIASVIDSDTFGYSRTGGGLRKNPALARVVAELATAYETREFEWWQGPLPAARMLPRREQPMIIIPPPQTGGDDGSQAGGDNGSQQGRDDGSQQGRDDGSQTGGNDRSQRDGDDAQQQGDDDQLRQGDDDGSGLASAGALGSMMSYTPGPTSLPQPASSPMVGAVPGVIGSERLSMSAPGGSAAGGPGMVPPMMGMMGGGAAAAGSPDQSRRSGKFWREDEIEWSRDAHAQWVDPDEQPPSTLDAHRA